MSTLEDLMQVFRFIVPCSCIGIVVMWSDGCHESYLQMACISFVYIVCVCLIILWKSNFLDVEER